MREEVNGPPGKEAHSAIRGCLLCAPDLKLRSDYGLMHGSGRPVCNAVALRAGRRRNG